MCKTRLNPTGRWKELLYDGFLCSFETLKYHRFDFMGLLILINKWLLPNALKLKEQTFLALHHSRACIWMGDEREGAAANFLIKIWMECGELFQLKMIKRQYSDFYWASILNRKTEGGPISSIIRTLSNDVKVIRCLSHMDVSKFQSQISKHQVNTGDNCWWSGLSQVRMFIVGRIAWHGFSCLYRLVIGLKLAALHTGPPNVASLPTP